MTSAVFSPDEKQVLTSSVDGTVCLWRSDGDLVMTLTYPRGTYASNWDIWCSFSPDGQHMLVCNENTASLWDTGGRLCTTNWDARSQLDAYTEAFLQDPSRDDDPSASGEGYYVYTTGPDSTTVYVGYRASEYHSNRWYDITADNQLEQIREILADAGYVSSRPDEIYIQCSQP